MRATPFLAPNRWRKTDGAVTVFCQSPVGMFIGNQIHIQDLLAATRTKQSSIPKDMVLFDNIHSLWVEQLGYIFPDKPSRVPREDLLMNPFSYGMEYSLDPGHGICLSASSIKPRRGSLSPIPTLSLRMGHSPCSGSANNSILLRLHSTCANFWFGSSR